MVTLRFGVNTLQLAVSGQSVENVRRQAERLLSIPGDAQARINGVAVDNCTILTEGQTLEFVKTHGEKGSK